MTRETTYVASRCGAALDSDLRNGGGTDDTAALQAVLDRARDGEGVHLIVDGPARVSGLDLHSNTTIEGTPGAGLYLADGSDRAIIRNAHRSRDEIVDENIGIRGLFLGGNRDGQQAPWIGGPLPGDLDWDFNGAVHLEKDRSWKAPLQLLGVRGLVIEDVEIWDARAFSCWLANVSRVEIRNMTIDVNYGPYPADASVEEQIAFLEGTPPNLDGIHINGPADQVLIDGARITCRDDAVALDANDWGIADITLGDLSGPYAGQGPIVDVVVRNVHLDGPSHGIRLLSADQRIDRVSFENITGSVGMRAVNISHFAIPQTGEFGSVAFRDVALRAARSLTMREWFVDAYAQLDARNAFDEEGESPFFVVNAAMEELRLEDVSLSEVGKRPALLVGPDADIGSLAADIVVESPAAGSARIGIHDRSRIGRLVLDIRPRS